MDPRQTLSALVGSKRRMALLGLLVLGGAIGGGFALGLFGVPSVAAVDNTFGGVTNETTDIETDLTVSNPNPVGVGLDGVAVDYTISMNDIEMAQGGREGVQIGTGNSTLRFNTSLQNDDIPAWWVSHVRDGERTTVRIEATATSGLLGRGVDFSQTREIETDLLGAFTSDETRPVNADSALVDDPVLYVNETQASWGSVSESETPIDMAFTVYNPNLEPYAITEIGYTVTMNDVEMATGRTEEGYVIPSHSTETIELTAGLRNERLDEWWVTHLDETVNGHQVSDLRIDFYAVVELPGGQEVTVPLDELTYEETVETDIFGEGEDVRDGDASGDGSAGDDGSTSDDGGTDDESGGNTDGSTDGTDDGTDEDENTTDETDDENTSDDNTTDDGGQTDGGVLPL
ncbi:LEA type 2 family protein [Halorubrum laminariae]|uniref:LEA type 2 family protein n=1 Tax=Halorubrum laminariae TaxID=1433523 RepID=A0ABD6C3V0_9EURY|nr:LEA type 2 family protein [Halorubrum laminariae]